MRTIRVTGKGQLKVHPDMTRITIDLESICGEYADAVEKSSRDTDKLKKVLAPFGFDRTDLKTLSYSVDSEYESYKEHGAYRQRLIGYKYHHRLKVEFESDNKRLGKILYALANCPLSPEFRISHTVKDPEALKNELLGKAIQDAKAKATVISSAAGVALGEIQTMDYSWGRVDFEVRCMEDNILMAPNLAEGGGYNLDIEPDDIEAEDTVTVVWEIR